MFGRGQRYGDDDGLAFAQGREDEEDGINAAQAGGTNPHADKTCYHAIRRGTLPRPALSSPEFNGER